MSKYRRPDGTRAWPPRRGQVAELERARLKSLVRHGLASFWLPRRSVEEAIKAAGL